MFPSNAPRTRPAHQEAQPAGVPEAVLTGMLTAQVISHHLSSSEGTKPFRFTTRQQSLTDLQWETFESTNAFCENPK